MVHKTYTHIPENICAGSKLDLDLTYICDRLIAMAMPCVEGAIYRNDIREVSRFFATRHYGVCVCVCVCKCVRLSIHIHACIHAYKRWCVLCIKVCMCIYTYMHACMHVSFSILYHKALCLYPIFHRMPSCMCVSHTFMCICTHI
jgi:hypothetical protein